MLIMNPNHSLPNDEIKQPPMIAPQLSQALYTSRKRRLPATYVPGEFTVLCGRGKACFNSSGNRHLKSLVKKSLKSYSESQNKVHKSSIVSQIISEIKTKMSEDEPAFVKHEDGSWWELDDNFAREKVGSFFRDCLFTQYRSSTKAKQARKKQQQESSMTQETTASKLRSFASPSWDEATARRRLSFTHRMNPRMDLSSSSSASQMPFGQTQVPTAKVGPLLNQAADILGPTPLPEGQRGMQNQQQPNVTPLSSYSFLFPITAKTLTGYPPMFARRGGGTAGGLGRTTASFNFPSSLTGEERKAGLPLSRESSSSSSSAQVNSSVLRRAYEVVTSDSPNAEKVPDEISGLLFKTDDLPDSFEDPFEDEE